MKHYGYAVMNLKTCNINDKISITKLILFRDKNKYTMRIFLFTNEDNPNVNDKNERDLIMHHAK